MLQIAFMWTIEKKWALCLRLRVVSIFGNDLLICARRKLQFFHVTFFPDYGQLFMQTQDIQKNEWTNHNVLQF